MKAIVIVLAISFVAVLSEFIDEERTKLRKNKEACISEIGVDPIVVENARNGQIAEDDEKFKCFCTCFLKKIEFMNDNGDIDWEVIRAKMLHVPQEQVNQIYNACKDITGTGCAKGHNVLKCFVKNKAFRLN